MQPLETEPHEDMMVARWGAAHLYFKKDSLERDIFFPFAFLGRGRILPEGEEGDRISRKVGAILNVGDVLLLFLMMVGLVHPLALLAAFAAVTAMTRACWKSVRNLPYSDVQLLSDSTMRMHSFLYGLLGALLLMAGATEGASGIALAGAWFLGLAAATARRFFRSHQ